MEEGLEDRLKAAKVKAAEEAEDPASQAVEAKVQGRTLQSTLATRVSMEKARKERKASREKLHSKAREKASDKTRFNNQMSQPPMSLRQLSQKPGAHMKQVGHGTHMDTTQTSTTPKMSGRQVKPLGNNGRITRTDSTDPASTSENGSECFAHQSLSTILVDMHGN